MIARRPAARQVVFQQDLMTLPETITFSKRISRENGLFRALNQDIDELVMRNGERLPEFRTATFMVYGHPGEELSPTISYDGISYGVPQRYQRKRDIALLFEMAFNMEGEKDNWTFKGKITSRVENFPRTNGAYLPNSMGIPHGELISPDDPRARVLRRTDGPYIGSVVRCNDPYYVRSRRYVSVDYRTKDRLRFVVLELAGVLEASKRPS